MITILSQHSSSFFSRHIQASPKPLEARHHQGGPSHEGPPIPHPSMRGERPHVEPVQRADISGQADDI